MKLWNIEPYKVSTGFGEIDAVVLLGFPFLIGRIRT